MVIDLVSWIVTKLVSKMVIELVSWMVTGLMFWTFKSALTSDYLRRNIMRYLLEETT